MSSFTKLYQEKIASGEIQEDVTQACAIPLFESLLTNILTPPGNSKSLMFWKKQEPDVKQQGIYLYGNVGRGKSMLMDMFFNSVDIENKKRVHFHEFLTELHDFLHELRQSSSERSAVDDYLLLFADKIAADTKLFCFDEFYVTDVADAMLLGRLFTELFKKGVFVIATSNIKPDDLYKDGLQRERFIPFIDLLKSRMELISFDGDIDYRMQMIESMGSYFYPINKDNQDKVESLFIELTKNHDPVENNIVYKGREIELRQAFGDVVSFTFDELCDDNLGAGDYLEITKNFNVVILTGLPVLGNDDKDKTKRFINLIDTFYDNKIHLVILAESSVNEIYKGSSHAFAFDRTVSRLIEMQSKTYLIDDV